MTYSAQQISQAAFDAADELQERYSLDSSGRSLLDLLISLTVSRLEKPGISMDDTIRETWPDEEPEDIDEWIAGEYFND